MTDKKVHIINTALQLFAEKGFEGTSVREIAEKASVNLAMVNYYFGSKDKLFENIIEHKSLITHGKLDEISKDKSLTHFEKVERIIESFIEKLFTHRSFHRLIQQELILNQREDLQQLIVNFLFPNSLIMKHIIESGIRSGEFKKVDVELTIATLMGTINQVLMSKKLCNKLMNKEDNYIPYDDVKFRKRVFNHMKQLMQAHLLK